MTSKPIPLPVHVAGIPDVLTRERRFVLWRYLWRQHTGDDGGKWTKPPFQPNGHPAKSDDPATWRTFAEVLTAYDTGHFDGIGFTLGSTWAGVDVDDYAKPWPVLDRLPAYRERSPSGTGIKFIGRAARIGGEIDFAKSPPSFTTWNAARYFTLTGCESTGDPTADLSAFIDEWFRTPVFDVSSIRTGFPDADITSDDDLLLLMAGNECMGDRFLALWRGDTSAYGGNQSRADMALVDMLAWWCNFDMQRVDRLFRQSNLMRVKWNAASYRRATLSKAAR